MTSERLRRLLAATERGLVLPESEDYERAVLDPDEAAEAARMITSDPSAALFHVQMTLWRAAPDSYEQVPAAARAQVLAGTLAGYRQLNDFGYLDPHGSYDGPAALALLELGDAALTALEPLLADDRPAPLSGSEEATLAKRFAYRRKDFAFRYVSKLRGRDAPFDPDPAHRDAAIAALREQGN
jgi:hypothetical protein